MTLKILVFTGILLCAVLAFIGLVVMIKGIKDFPIDCDYEDIEDYDVYDTRYSQNQDNTLRDSINAASVVAKTN